MTDPSHTPLALTAATLPGGRSTRMGVDQTLPDQFLAEADKQLQAGLIPQWAYDRIESGLGYGEAGGWQFHHHHIHLSLMDR